MIAGFFSFPKGKDEVFLFSFSFFLGPRSRKQEAL